MTIAATISSGPMIGNGVNPSFPFSFTVAGPSELYVQVNGATVSSALYTVNLNSNGTGTVVFSVAPVNGAVVTIFSGPDFTQETIFENEGSYSLTSVNATNRRQTIRSNLLAQLITKLLPAGWQTAANLVGKFVTFDAGGNPILSAGTGADIGLRTDMAATTGAALVGTISPGTGAIARTQQNKNNDWVNVKDFNVVGDGITDDTAALMAAHDAAPASGATIYIPGRYAISARLNFTKPIRWVGTEPGNKFQPVQASATEIIWIGATTAGAMCRVGMMGIGTTSQILWGGGMENIHFNGGGLAAYGLEIGDASMGTYRRVSAHNQTAAGLHLTSSGAKTGLPSAWNSFYKCFFDMRSALAASANAHGVLVNAVNGTNAGVTLAYFEDLKVNHSGGDGVHWNQGGDGFNFVKSQFFRADAETGYSCNFASALSTDICNHAIFHYPIATGGMYFATAGLHRGTMIHDYDGQNINAGLANLISGPGAGEVGGNSTFGQLFGTSRLLSNQDVVRSDSMDVIYTDNANNILFTNAGAWKIVSGGGVVGAATTFNGGGARIQTTAGATDNTLITHVTSAANGGVSSSLWPVAQFSIGVVDTAAVKARWGLFDSNADPAGDGVWVEFDSALSGGQYRCVVSRGLTQTVVVNPAGITGAGNPNMRWIIDVQPTSVVFSYAVAGAPNPQLLVVAATITTNIPISTSLLLLGVYIKTTAAAIKAVNVGDIRMSTRVEFR